MKGTHLHHNCFMQLALIQAYRGHLFTAPNPMVGCVIVKNQQVIASGYHEHYGQNHAEINALNAAKSEAAGSDVYVTLEPCSHCGKTPPCVNALIAAKVKRVIIPFADPNPQVNGRGIALLRANGIEVIEGVLSEACYDINRSFLSYMANQKPYVIAKWAMTNEGRLSLPHTPWISNALSREHAHQLRQTCDAILIGANTLKLDNPRLTTRLPIDPACIRHPLRIILTTRGDLPVDSHLLAGQLAGKTMIVSAQPLPVALEKHCLEKGIDFLECPDEQGGVDLEKLLSKLSARAITSLVVEGGRTTLQHWFKRGLVDEIRCYISDYTPNRDLISSFTGKANYAIKETLAFENDTYIRGNVYV